MENYGQTLHGREAERERESNAKEQSTKLSEEAPTLVKKLLNCDLRETHFINGRKD